jgi:hypothetical protein
MLIIGGLSLFFSLSRSLNFHVALNLSVQDIQLILIIGGLSLSLSLSLSLTRLLSYCLILLGNIKFSHAETDNVSTFP